MRREIVFKARRISDGKWVSGSFINKEGMCFIYDTERHSEQAVDPKTVSQYTGLRDANGFGVFENDVLQSTINEEAYGIVGWNPEGFWCIVASRYYLLGMDFPLGTYSKTGVNEKLLANCKLAGSIWDDDVRDEFFGLLKYSKKE